MEFEREYRAPPQARQRDDLWWQIALGIFVGQLMTGAVIGIMAMAMGAYAANEAEKAMAELQQDMPKFSTPGPTKPAATRRSTSARIPLRSGERCIAGDRFRRLENGYAQVLNEPC